MFGLNWVDGVIVLLTILVVTKLIKVGVVTQLGIVAGFFATLFLAGWLFPHLLNPIHDRTLLTIINANLVLLVAAYGGVKGYDYGRKVHVSIIEKKWHWIVSAAGAILGTASVLVISWLIAATVGRMPFEGLSNSSNDALIVQKLNANLPPVPSVLAEFNRLVNPNAEPYNFEHITKQPDLEYSKQDFKSAVNKAQQSAVRITSFGCGGIASGSGFAIAPELVVTNAHVIAGVKRPIIKYHQRSYEGVPIYFDTSKDLAVIRVKDLPAPALHRAEPSMYASRTVAVIGFPGGNFNLAPGVIRNQDELFGRNIYDLGVAKRDVYEIQVQVAEGSSGSPVVQSDGSVVGVLFAKSNEVDGYGFALTSSSIDKELLRSENLYRRVSTGACLAN